MADTTKRYAVVTGANKGIGLETVRQLASAGINVVLTARDEKRGLEALEKLKDLSELVIFHQLDVSDSASVASLSHFIKSHFGKLDILVNNAGILGITEDIDAAKASAYGGVRITTHGDRTLAQTYELAEECLEINYYGAKRTAESLLPLLRLSDSPTIVNVSSMMGKLEKVTNEWAKGMLCDVENLTEDRVDEVLKEFLKDFRETLLEVKGWPKVVPAYTLSKAAMNAYTRILAKKHPYLCVNSVCPGIVKTDMSFNYGILPVEEGAASPVRLALLPNGSPSGLFYLRSEVSSF